MEALLLRFLDLKRLDGGLFPFWRRPMKNSKLFENQLRKMRKENIECLWEELTEDSKVVMTSEFFNSLSSVMSVWRCDLREKMIILTDDLHSLSKAERAIAFGDSRFQKLLGRYFDIINEITEEAERRRKSIELLQEA